MLFFFDDFLFNRFFYLKFNNSKKLIFLLFLLYFMHKGKKEQAESILKHICIYLNNLLKIRLNVFPKNMNVILLLNIVFNYLLVDFKIIIFSKKKYFCLTFDDLIKDHSYIYKDTVVPTKGKNLKMKQNKNNLQIKIIPVSVSLRYKCLKSFIFLIKGAKHQKGFYFVEKFSREVIVTYFRCSLSYRIKNEINKIACLYKSNIRFF